MAAKWGGATCPRGKIGPHTLAEDYPREAYVTPGDELLPWVIVPTREDRDRYKLRIRKTTFEVPRDILVQGQNAVAIEIHRTARRNDIPPPANERNSSGWDSLGMMGIRLTAQRASGLVPNASPPEAIQLWNADVMQSIGNKASYAGPFGQLRPMRLVAPRRAFCSGKVVVSARETLADVSASISPFKHRDGEATIPESAVRVRYAAHGVAGGVGDQPDWKYPFFDTLRSERTEKDRLQPIWVTVEVPADAQPGQYEATLQVVADGVNKSVPIQLDVVDWTLPKPQDWTSWMGMVHSPETIAMYYGVEPFSARHFELMEPSLRLLGQVGQDIVYVPAIAKTHFSNEHSMIRWFKKGDLWDVDLSIVRRYLDLVEKHVGPPEVLCLYVWELYMGVERHEPPLVTVVDRKTGKLNQITAPAYGERASEAFFRPMIEAMRLEVKRRGWKSSSIMLGVAADERPSREVVQFFHRIAPEMRWTILTHGDSDPTISKGRLILDHGMEIGYYEEPSSLNDSIRYERGPLVYGWEWPFPVASVGRHRISQRASAINYRALQAESVGALESRRFRQYRGSGRLGLDFWPVKPPEGKTGSLLGRYEDWLGLARDTPRWITAPGQHGAEPTARYEMFREGVQEVEAQIFIEQALADPDLRPQLSPSLARRCMTVLDARLVVRLGSHRLPEQHISGDWAGLSAQLYRLAGEVAKALTP